MSSATPNISTAKYKLQKEPQEKYKHSAAYCRLYLRKPQHGSFIIILLLINSFVVICLSIVRHRTYLSQNNDNICICFVFCQFTCTSVISGRDVRL